MNSDTGASDVLMASKGDCDRRKDTELLKRGGDDNCMKEEREIRSDGFGSDASESVPNPEENLFQEKKNGQEWPKTCLVVDLDNSTVANGSERCQDVEEKIDDCQKDDIQINVVVDRFERLNLLEASQKEIGAVLKEVIFSDISSELVENANENAEQKGSKSSENCHEECQEEQSREGLLCGDAIIVKTDTDLDASILVSSDLAENPQKSVPSERNEPKSEPAVDFEKSEPNPQLLAVILRHPMASKWESTSHAPHALVTVCPGSSEYKTVKKMFERTSFGVTISKLERVENPYLLGHYLLKKEKMQMRQPIIGKTSLFHGTRKNFVKNICRFNFDWRRKGSSTGHEFGQGVYFASEVWDACNYTPDRVMFLVKVLVAKAHMGTRDTVLPMESYDTTKNFAGTIIVKYEDDDFYPQYVIHFDYEYQNECGV